MKFSEWTKRSENQFLDNAAGDHYELLPQTSKDCIDSAIERYIMYRQSNNKTCFEHNVDLMTQQYLLNKKRTKF